MVNALHIISLIRRLFVNVRNIGASQIAFAKRMFGKQKIRNITKHDRSIMRGMFGIKFL